MALLHAVGRDRSVDRESIDFEERRKFRNNEAKQVQAPPQRKQPRASLTGGIDVLGMHIDVLEYSTVGRG